MLLLHECASLLMFRIDSSLSARLLLLSITGSTVADAGWGVTSRTRVRLRDVNLCQYSQGLRFGTCWVLLCTRFCCEIVAFAVGVWGRRKRRAVAMGQPLQRSDGAS